MDNEEYMIPVFFINGQLEAGKTTFIEEIIGAGQFDAAQKKLLISFEEGEVEYSKDLLDEHGIDLYVSSHDDLNKLKLEELDKTYDPWLVIVEYNGMWDPKDFTKNGLPDGWAIYQSITIINAATFENQWKNMKSIMAETVKGAESVVFNRCRDGMDLGAAKRSIKALNPAANIIFEDEAGKIITGTNDTLPYEMDADIIEISDNDFGVWFIDCRDREDAYRGKKVKITAEVIKDPRLAANEFVAARKIMTCCADDIALTGYIAEYTGPVHLKDKDWVEIVAEITYENKEEYNGVGPVLKVESLTKTQAPEQEVVQI